MRTARRRFSPWSAWGCLLALSACASILPQPAEPPVFMTLERMTREGPAPAAGAMAQSGAPVLIVEPPRPAPGFDSQRMIYVRSGHTLEYFSRHQWIDAPARLLTPLLVAALEDAVAFGAVLVSPAPVAGDMRLESEDLRLYQDFSSRPSRVRLSLRAMVIDSGSRRIVAQRHFQAEAAAPSDDPRGGVVAANQAAASLLAELAAFAAQAAATAEGGASPGLSGGREAGSASRLR